jgi:hypothetical protein
MLTLASEIKDLRSKWKTLSIYERFEQTVVAVLTLVIAVIVAIATWQLLLYTLKLVGSHVVYPADPQAFQRLFGMVLTVLIALLTLVRRFIILDLLSDQPERDCSPRRSGSGARNRILARQQSQNRRGRGNAGVIVATPPATDGHKRGTQPQGLFSVTRSSTKGDT